MGVCGRVGCLVASDAGGDFASEENGSHGRAQRPKSSQETNPANRRAGDLRGLHGVYNFRRDKVRA